MKNAIVLCSGGLDSVMTSYYVKERLNYGKLIILFFNYGQRSLLQERRLSKKCAEKLKAEFFEIKIDFFNKSSSHLIKNRKVRKIKKEDLKDKKESNKFYVPFRNGVFLVYAMAYAEDLLINNQKICDIFVGFCNEGFNPYPDTTPEFVKHMNNLMKSQKLKGRIIAPLIKKNKEDVISLGEKLGVDFEETFSCYVNNEKHCGVCLACKLRQDAFHWANLKDPTDYKEKMEDSR